MEISPPPESDERGRVKSSGERINKLSSPLFLSLSLSILFQVQLQVPPPVPVSTNAEPSTGAAVPLGNSPLSRFRSFGETHLSTVTSLHVCLAGVAPARLSVCLSLSPASPPPLCACLSSLRAKRRGPRVLHYSWAFLLPRPFITATPR